MYSLVSVKVTDMTERLWANITNKFPTLSMNIQVSPEVRLFVKAFPTYITFKLDFLLMIFLCMIFQLALSVKFEPTNSALVGVGGPRVLLDVLAEQFD